MREWQEVADRVREAASTEAIFALLGVLVGATIPSLFQWFISKRESVDKFRLA